MIILATGENVSVIVKRDSKIFVPFVMQGTKLFDPRWNFRPVNPTPKARSLHEGYREEATRLIAEAENKWTPPVQPGEPAPAGYTEPFPSPRPASETDRAIAESVINITVGNVVEAAKPLVADFIAETYGKLPRHSIEVVGPNGTHEVKGITHEKFETVLKLASLDIPVFLTGPAGCGKNVICTQVAEALGLEFYFSNAVTQEYKLTGFIDANGRYHETQFYKAFVNGGLFMLDEIDASTPEVLVILNAAIANRYFDFPTGRVNAHESFRLVAAGNTYGTGADIEYTGRYQLDAASLDRFAIVEIDYSAAIEEAIAEGDMALVEFVQAFRKAVEGAKIKFVVSYRSTERLHKLKDVFDQAEAVKIALLRGMAKDDAAQIARNIADNDNAYTKAFKQAVA